MNDYEKKCEEREQEKQLQLALSKQRTSKIIAYIVSLGVTVILGGLAFGPIYGGSVYREKQSLLVQRQIDKFVFLKQKPNKMLLKRWQKLK